MAENNPSEHIKNLLEQLEQQKKFDPSTDWKELQNRIARNRLRQNIFNFTRNAAAVLLPVLLLWHFISKPGDTIFSPKMVEIVSSQIGTIKIVLPDSSVVWLNASSKLRYPQVFDKKNRNVELQGEGCFIVNADKNRRFNVAENQKVIVSAYGTKFNIRAPEQSQNCEVVL